MEENFSAGLEVQRARAGGGAPFLMRMQVTAAQWAGPSVTPLE
jgi:hypothetical protein